MVEFIRRNPAETSFRDAVGFAGQQRRADQTEQVRQQQIDAGERTKRLDTTLAGELSGAEGTVGTLARGGFGGEAHALQQNQQAGRDQDERNAMIALASYGKTGSAAELQNFNMLAQKAGLQVPPDVMADTRQAGLFAQASLIAEKTYTDPKQAVMFTRAYLRSGGDIEKAATIAGAPRDKPNWTVRNVMRDGQQILALIDSVGGGVRFPTTKGAEGQPEFIQTPARTAAGGQPPAKVQMAEWLMRNKVAKSHEEAWQMVSMAVQNPLTARTSVFNSVYNSLVRGFPPTDPKEAQRIANEVADQFVSGMGSPFGGSPAPGGDPAGGAGNPTPPPNAEETKVIGGKTYYRIGDQWFEESQ